MTKIEELITKYKSIEDNYESNPNLDCHERGVEAGKADLSWRVVEDLEQLKSSLPKPVEVPDIPQHIVEYLEWCKLRDVKLKDVIGAASAYHSDYAYWTEKEIRKIAVAYSTGNYTVVKEPLYYVQVGAKYFQSWLNLTSITPVCISNMDDAWIFSKKDQADKVATLIDGEVVPVEEDAQ